MRNMGSVRRWRVMSQRALGAALATVALLGLLPASVWAQNVTVIPGGSSYATLKDAFDAINAGTHTGSIVVNVVGDNFVSTRVIEIPANDFVDAAIEGG